MPISVTCPNNHKLNVSETLSGKKVKCPKCGGVVMVGALSEVPSPTPPNRSTTPAAQLNQTKPTTPAPLPLDPFPDSIDPLSAPFPDVPAFPSPAAVQPTSSRSSTQPIKTKAQPKGHIWDSLLLSLAVSLGLFFGIVSGGSLWAMFMLDFSNGKATAARGSNGLIEPRDNPNSNQAANVKPQTLNPQASNTDRKSVV